MWTQWLDETASLAREAGAAVRARFTDAKVLKDKGGGENPLTEADLASNEILHNGLRALVPEAGWLSEETADTPERLGRRLCWIVDPLDGTKEFTLGIPEFVVSIALVEDGVARLGVLYNPIRDQLFTGLVDGPRSIARLNGAPVRVTGHDTLAGARVVCSRTEMQKGWFEPYRPYGLQPEPVGSVAYKFGMVAAGLAEASFTPQPRHEWDIAGGVALVEAAGGRTSDRHGRPFVFNAPKPLVDGVVATNGPLHEALRGIIGQG
jgi:myo-inositol-1(or 4)-monophosphatase